ncbi:hypothetical protein CMI42_05510 [Candidatus Pacearchaeota archaeon]|nr:hypothetical protein [Candidatus Pacearchaeota archaeon]
MASVNGLQERMDNKARLFVEWAGEKLEREYNGGTANRAVHFVRNACSCVTASSAKVTLEDDAAAVRSYELSAKVILRYFELTDAYPEFKEAEINTMDGYFGREDGTRIFMYDGHYRNQVTKMGIMLAAGVKTIEELS